MSRVYHETLTALSIVNGPVPASDSSATQTRTAVACTSAAANAAHRSSTSAGHVDPRVETVVSFWGPCASVHLTCSSQTVIRSAASATYVSVMRLAVVSSSDACASTRRSHQQLLKIGF